MSQHQKCRIKMVVLTPESNHTCGRMTRLLQSNICVEKITKRR
jgi:hypothetical protein